MSSYAKAKKILFTLFEIPGTFIEIRDNKVICVKPSKRPQRNEMTNDLKRGQIKDKIQKYLQKEKSRKDRNRKT